MNKLFGLYSINNINLLNYNDNIFEDQKKYLNYNCLLLSNINDPFVKYDCQDKYVIIYNGYLSNKDELKCKLRTLGYQFKTDLDEEVIINSYIYYKEKCFNYFKGGYSIAIFTKDKIIIARDKLGVKPLFYSTNDEYFIFSNKIEYLLKSKLVKPIVNEFGLKELFALSPSYTPSYTPFKDIKMVKPGEYIIYENKELQKVLYYNLVSHRYNKDYESSKLELKNHLITSINRFNNCNSYGSLLSGGIDSSIISSLLDFSKLKNTYFLEYKDSAKYFKSNNFQKSLDKEYALIMSNFIKSNHNVLSIDEYDLINLLKESMKARDLPGMGDIDSSLYWLCSKIKDKYIFTGECSDEIFGGYPWYYKENNNSLFPWIRNIDVRQNLLNEKYKYLNLNKHIKDSFNELMKDYVIDEYENENEKKWHKMTYINIYSFMQQLLYRQEMITNYNNLTAFSPFIDIDLVEFAYNLPSTYKYNGKYEKSILKDAFKNKLPESVINREKNPYPKTFNPHYEELVYEKIYEYLNDSTSSINRFFDKKEIEKLIINKNVSIPFYGQLMTNIQLLAYLIQFEEWVKEYNIIFEV